MADIKVRVGQQNSVKVISSISGAAGGFANVAQNVIGGIASVTSLNVSGESTFNDLLISGNATISGITTISNGFYGVAYFDNTGLIVSTAGTDFSIDYTNYILTTDNSGTPVWSSVIDGGSY